jgi:hypothetical protein
VSYDEQICRKDKQVVQVLRFCVLRGHAILAADATGEGDRPIVLEEQRDTRGTVQSWPRKSKLRESFGFNAIHDVRYWMRNETRADAVRCVNPH